MKTLKDHKAGLGPSIGAAIVLLFVGVVSALIAFAAINNYGLTTEVTIKDCGFFSSCEEGSYKEKVEEVRVDPNAPEVISVVVIAYVAVIGAAFVIYYLVKGIDSRVLSVATIVALGVLTAAIMYAHQGAESRIESRIIGSVTEEEYGCQTRAIRALEEMRNHTEECTLSAEAEAFWRLDSQ